MLAVLPLTGDPDAIRDSACLWSLFSSTAESAAGQIRALPTDQFVADEADVYRSQTLDALASRLSVTSEAWLLVSSALTTYSVVLQTIQGRMRQVASDATDQQQRVDVAQDAVTNSRQADLAHAQAMNVRTAPAAPPCESPPADTYLPQLPQSAGGLAAAQAGLQAEIDSAGRLRIEHDLAVSTCVGSINRAAEMHFFDRPTVGSLARTPGVLPRVFAFDALAARSAGLKTAAGMSAGAAFTLASFGLTSEIALVADGSERLTPSQLAGQVLSLALDMAADGIEAKYGAVIPLPRDKTYRGQEITDPNDPNLMYSMITTCGTDARMCGSTNYDFSDNYNASHSVKAEAMDHAEALVNAAVAAGILVYDPDQGSNGTYHAPNGAPGGYLEVYSVVTGYPSAPAVPPATNQGGALGAYTGSTLAEVLEDQVTGAVVPSSPTGPGPDYNSLISKTISRQRQARHVLGTRDGNEGGYFTDAADAQKVLDAYHSGAAKFVRVTTTGNIIIKYDAVTGFNNNVGVGYLDQPTHTFMIKGTKSVSIVPIAPGG